MAETALVLDSVPLSYDIRELRGSELPATQFLVHDRVPYGLWIHAAPPGGYKSAYAAQLEHHIAFGTPIPGLDWEFAQTGDCLVISPDETAYETQERSFRVLPGGQLATDGLESYVPYSLPSIHVRHDPHGATMAERIAWLWREIELIEAKTGRPLVWIRWDTLGNLLGDRGTTDAYTASQPLQKLNARMANEHRVMFLPNHLGKDGRAIGSVNNTACANLSTKAVITKASNTGSISCLDEDGAGDVKMRGGRGWCAAVVLRNGLLELTDQSPQEAGHKLGSLPNEVTHHLRRSGGATVAQLRAGLGIADKPLWNCILRLKKGSEIWNDEGTWKLVETGSVSHWPATWTRCQRCACGVDPARGCVNVRCEHFVMSNWDQEPAADEPGPVSVSIPAQESRPPDDAVAAIESSVPFPETAPAALAPPPAPAAIEDQAPAPLDESWCEQWPELAGNPAVEKLIECVRESPLYGARKVSEEIRAQMPYERVTLGGTPNKYQFFPGEPPPAMRRVLILDRKAAYFQSTVAWMVPNLLHRQGDLDYGQVVRDNLAGMFEILYTPWESKDYPDPINGKHRRGSKLLVPRPVLDRVMDTVKLGFRQEPAIMFGLVGKGTERSPMFHWGDWCMKQRRAASSAAELAGRKEAQNGAFGTLRVADPLKNRGPVDRPDWQYAVIGNHYAQVNRFVYKALNAGEPVIAAGNTDEIVFLIPEDQPAELAADGTYTGWLPETMRPALERGRFSVKDVRDAGTWFGNPMDREASRGANG